MTLKLARYLPGFAAAAVYLVFALIKEGPAGLASGAHWAPWWDQSLYLQSATALAQGNLAAEAHWYPLLYPLLAAPFVWLLPGHPFLPLDIACVGVMAQAMTGVAARLGIGKPASLAIFLATGFLHAAMPNSWLAPWTSTLSGALIWSLLAVAASLLDAARLDPRRMAALGLIAALVPLTRPAEALVVLAAALFVCIHLARRGTLDRTAIGWAMAGAAAAILPYGALHLAIYGAATSPYMRLSAAIGLHFSGLGWKAWTLYVDPAPWFPAGAGILRRMPWLVLGLAGAGFALACGDAPRRRLAALLVLVAATHIILLTAYAGLLPTSIWATNGIHYFKWLLPLFGLFAWLLIRDGWRSPRSAGIALAAVLLITCLRFDAVPASAQETARRIDFAAPAGESALRIYFAASAIGDGAGLRRNIVDYRQVADAGIVRAVALGPEFAPDARWFGGGVASLDWPEGLADPNAALSGNWPAAPTARWKAKLGFGAPCWLMRCAPASASIDR